MIGTLPRLRSPVVVECRPPGGMASGELPWSLAEPLARRLPGTDAQGVHETDDLARIAAATGRRDVVLVVRDPIRHIWQLDLIPLATVIVDVGWPVELPGELPTIRTRGVAPGLLAAAAEVLAG